MSELSKAQKREELAKIIKKVHPLELTERQARLKAVELMSQESSING